MLQLRPYQHAAVSAVHEAAKAGLSRVVVTTPTGSGKCVIACELMKQREERALFVAHRDELISQAEAKVKMIWPGVGVGIVKGERDERDKQVVIASVQTIARTRRALQPVFKTIIVDECHHLPSESWKSAIAAAGAYVPGVMTVGFTATTERSDRKALGGVFEKIVYSMTLLQGIQQGWLCDLRAKQVSLAVDLDSVKTRGGDYEDAALGSAMHAAGAPAKVAEAWLKYGEGRKSLCYAPTVAIAQEIEAELRQRGVKVACVWGEQAIDARRAVLAAYAEGRFQVLTNCAVLLEGYDDPATACIIMARPTKSRVLYQQAIGRGTRTWPGKADCLVLDCVGVTAEHDLLTLATLLGVREQTAERGVLDTVRRAKEGQAVEGSLTAEDVALFDRGKLHWIIDGRRFLLPAGDATLSLQQEGLTWSVYSIPRDRKQPTQKLYAELSREYAIGACEDTVRLAGAMPLARAGADWRNREASPKQVALLKEWGVWRPGMRAGEASDAISVRMVRRRA